MIRRRLDLEDQSSKIFAEVSAMSFEFEAKTGYLADAIIVGSHIAAIIRGRASLCPCKTTEQDSQSEWRYLGVFSGRYKVYSVNGLDENEIVIMSEERNVPKSQEEKETHATATILKTFPNAVFDDAREEKQ